MSRLVSWFSTPKGRIFTRTCIGITGLSIFGIQVAVNGPLQENFKEMIQIYENGKPKPLSKKVKSLVHDVLEDCKLEKQEKKKMKFFNVIGQDLYHTGGTNSPWGAMIGIPFFFEDPKDISFAKLRIEGHESIDWIVDGQDLLDALTLSDNAKKFGLMREIYSCNIWDVMDNVSVSTGCFFFPALFIRRMNAKRDYLGKVPFRIRVCFYIACYAFGYALYRCLKDPLKHITAKKYDRMAAAVGPEYLDGGIEFYKKALLQNKALRELLGPRGEKLYDKDGNENYVLLAPKLPLRKRLELLQEMKATEMKTVPA
ncbi:transmembrane protein 177-like [Argiope bruennichi]|uniref:transmembrane protein 177-like n=1 Tax=Argiope bruennichi TaxID=94029 RepID=UPI00249440E9|nr:transmembrane protein 177-like [Argiope bruennichi]